MHRMLQKKDDVQYWIQQRHMCQKSRVQKILYFWKKKLCKEERIYNALDKFQFLAPYARPPFFHRLVQKEPQVASYVFQV